MSGTPPLDVDLLYRLLRRAPRRGARASRLLRHVPELVDLLCPPLAHPGLSVYDRALQAEKVIREAVEAIGGPAGEALTIVLGLAPGAAGRKLEERRRAAATLLDVQPDTFRRHWHEATLLFDLAVEIYQHRRGA